MPDYTPTYALYDPWTLMCFLRNAPLPLDTGYGHKPQLTELSRARPLVTILSEAIRLHRPSDDAASGVPGAVADLPSADELGAAVTSAAGGLLDWLRGLRAEAERYVSSRVRGDAAAGAAVGTAVTRGAGGAAGGAAGGVAPSHQASATTVRRDSSDC